MLSGVKREPLDVLVKQSLIEEAAIRCLLSSRPRRAVDWVSSCAGVTQCAARSAINVDRPYWVAPLPAILQNYNDALVYQRS